MAQAFEIVANCSIDGVNGTMDGIASASKIVRICKLTGSPGSARIARRRAGIRHA
jgi:hypothetical protein